MKDRIINVLKKWQQAVNEKVTMKPEEKEWLITLIEETCNLIDDLEKDEKFPTEQIEHLCLSPYMPAHCFMDPDCCGIFNVLNEDNMVICNECGMTISDAIDNIMKQGEEMNPTCVVVDKKEYKFKKKWDESINVNWMKESRIEINKIIDAYNYWQIEDDFNKGKALFVLTKIKYGKQIIGTQDGGDDYWDELDEMEQFVLHKIEQERS